MVASHSQIATPLSGKPYLHPEPDWLLSHQMGQDRTDS